ncbi:MAG: MarR family transcriptional regulator [Xanthobacteraceae bacterium]|jgi:DNA-binding MarR family transcriptional regulator
MARKTAAPRRREQRRHLPLTDLIAFRLIHLADVISRAASAAYEKQHGINNSELRALIVLREQQPLSVGELSRRGRIDKAWVSRSLDHLGERGLVARTPHPTDNRMVLISLTPAGVAMIDRLAPIAWERQKRLLSGLPRRDALKVIEILERNADDMLSNP